MPLRSYSDVVLVVLMVCGGTFYIAGEVFYTSVCVSRCSAARVKHLAPKQ